MAPLRPQDPRPPREETAPREASPVQPGVTPLSMWQAAMCLARMQVPSIPVDTQDDTGVDQRAEDEIWEVTEGPAEEYDETEGEDGEGDAVAALLELAQWELVE